MTGKPLSALLQILRSAGVTDYTLTTENGPVRETVTLKLGPAPAPKRPRDAIELTPEDIEDEPPPEDFRFALENTARKWFPRAKADPRKVKTS